MAEHLIAYMNLIWTTMNMMIWWLSLPTTYQVAWSMILQGSTNQTPFWGPRRSRTVRPGLWRPLAFACPKLPETLENLSQPILPFPRGVRANRFPSTSSLWSTQVQHKTKANNQYEPLRFSSSKLIYWEMPMSWKQTHAACESLPWSCLFQRIGKPHGWNQKPSILMKNTMYF